MRGPLSTELCPSQSWIKIYSFQLLPEAVLSCIGSKEYMSIHDSDGHSSVGLPNTEIVHKKEISLLKNLGGMKWFEEDFRNVFLHMK